MFNVDVFNGYRFTKHNMLSENWEFVALWQLHQQPFCSGELESELPNDKIILSEIFGFCVKDQLFSKRKV